MAIKSPGFVQVTTATTGFGPYTLTNTIPTSNDYRSIAQAVTDGSLANGDTVHYVIFQTGPASGKMFERGWGTINTTTLVLTPTIPSERSAALTSGGGWGAGTKDVYFAPPGAESVALLEFTNRFTQDQVISKAAPALLFETGGVYRASVNQASTDLWVQYFTAAGVLRGQLLVGESSLWQYLNASGVVKGQLTIGDNILDFSDGTTSRKVVRYIGGAAVKQTFNCAPPTFWTRINVTGERVGKYATAADTPEAQGGSWTVSGLTVSGAVDSYALAIADIPSHNHSMSASIGVAQSGSGITVFTVGGGTTGNTGGGGTHSHTITNQPVSSSAAWRPAYEIIVKASFD